MIIVRTRHKFWKLVVLPLIVLISVVYVLNQQRSWIRKLRIFQRSEQPHWLSRKDVVCKAAENIAYLKTHKCSSSAIQNILFRFGLKHNLIFAVPNTGSYFGRFIPFQFSMIPKNLITAFDLNIFAIHTIWDHDQVKSVMPDQTIFFTTIREPSSLFESLYSYAVDKNGALSLDQYVRETGVTDERVNGHIGFNQMSFDLGFQLSQMENLEYVREKILETDKNFDLVLVTEKMEESLILLRHLLCWTLEDVVVIKLNARQEMFKTIMTDSTKKILAEKQSADQMLYDHFYRKFLRLVREFGEERMNREVEDLRIATEKMTKDCGLETIDYEELRGRNKVFSNKVSGYVSESRDPDCQNLVSSELFLIDRIKKLQRQRINRKVGRKLDSPLEDLPFGAIALNDQTHLKETAETLKKYLKYS